MSLGPGQWERTFKRFLPHTPFSNVFSFARTGQARLARACPKSAKQAGDSLHG